MQCLLLISEHQSFLVFSKPSEARWDCEVVTSFPHKHCLISSITYHSIFGCELGLGVPPFIFFIKMDLHFFLKNKYVAVRIGEKAIHLNVSLSPLMYLGHRLVY